MDWPLSASPRYKEANPQKPGDVRSTGAATSILSGHKQLVNTTCLGPTTPWIWECEHGPVKSILDWIYFKVKSPSPALRFLHKDLFHRWCNAEAWFPTICCSLRFHPGHHHCQHIHKTARGWCKRSPEKSTKKQISQRNHKLVTDVSLRFQVPALLNHFGKSSSLHTIFTTNLPIFKTHNAFCYFAWS